MKKKILPYSAKRLATESDKEILLHQPSFLKDEHINHILSQIIKNILDEMGTSSCGIWLMDKEGHFIPRIVFGVKEELYAMTHSKRFERLLSYVVKRKKHIIIHNLMNFKDEKFKQMMKAEKMRSLVAYPILVNRIPIGVLIVGARKREPVLSRYKIRIGHIITENAALVLKNVYLYKRSVEVVRARRIETDTSLSLMKRLHSITQFTGNIKTNIIAVLKEIYKFSSADLILVKQYDKKRQRFNLVTFFPEYKILSAPHRDIDAALEREVIRRGAPFAVNNIDLYGEEVLNKCLDSNYKSCLAFPIFDDGNIIGMACVYWQAPRLLSELEFAPIEITCSLLAVFLSHSELVNKLKQSSLNVIKTLAMLTEAKDKYTEGHSRKVMEYSLIVCKRMRLPAAKITIIKEAALLHDLGKIAVDNSILHKKGALSEEEWAQIKKHPVVGAEIISRTDFDPEMVAIVRHHHERFGGGGYPDPELKNYDIPLGARIIAIADAYDAMTSDRPYRKAMEKEEVIKQLHSCSGTQFDPQIVPIFIEAICNN